MQKTILYAVLNWGLGHATRSIPIIQYLLNAKYRVIIVSDGDALKLLQDEFHGVSTVETVAYQVEYSREAKHFNIHLAKQIPKFIQVIKKEHADCISLCKQFDVDVIISDNRYGFYHPQLPSVLISHQLHLLYEENKWFEKIVNLSYQKYLRHFNELWVPDLAPPHSISGRMSALKWDNVRYLGIDSRLVKQDKAVVYESLSILSGPEPQRSLLEMEIINQLKNQAGKHCLIRGGTNLPVIDSGNVELIDFASKEVLMEKINASALVICRSGYTSLLDLLKLQKQAILIPTPGQVEQEHLAHSMKEKAWFSVTTQENLQLKQNENNRPPKLAFGYNFELIEQFLSC